MKDMKVEIMVVRGKFFPFLGALDTCLFCLKIKSGAAAVSTCGGEQSAMMVLTAWYMIHFSRR